METAGTKKIGLLAAIRELKKDDPFRKVVLLVRHSAESRLLFEEVAAAKAGLLNTFVVTPAEFIRSCSEHFLLSSGRRLARPLEQEEILRKVILPSLKWLGPVSEFDSVPLLAIQAMTSLRMSLPDADVITTLKSLPGPNASELGLLFEAYLAGLKKNNLADRPDLYRIFLDKFDPGTTAFLVSEGLETGMFKLELDCLNLIKKKAETRGLPPLAGPASFSFFTSQYDFTECREIAARIMKLAEKGVQFGRIAVACADRHYLEMTAEVLDNAGIAIHVPDGLPANHVLESLATLSLYDILAEDIPFDGLKRYLLYTSRFGQLNAARKAGVLKGGKAWKDRLEELIEEREGERAESYEKLKVLVSRFADFASKLPEEAGLGKFCHILAEAVNEFVPDIGTKKSILGLLSESGESDLKLNREEFKIRLESLLNSRRVPLSNREAGVCVSVHAARGVYDHVFAPGLTADRFPRKAFDNPLLPSDLLDKIAEKTAIDHPGTTAGLKALPERAFAELTSTARSSLTVSIPLYDTMEGKENQPTPWLVRFLEKTGAKIDGRAEELLKKARVPFSLESAGISLFEDEARAGKIFEKPELLNYYAGLDPNMGFGYLSEKEKFNEDEFGPCSGILGRECRSSKEALSASMIENMMNCPYHFLLEHILYVKPLEEPAPAEGLDPMTRGSLVHAILENFVKSERKGKPDDEEERKLLDKCADECLDSFAKEYPPEISVLWEKEKTDLKILLDNFLCYHLANRDKQAEAEWVFGMGDEPPLRMKFPGYEGLFRGKVDRLEKSGKEIRIVDYKSGKKGFGGADKVFDGGRIVQPFLYAEAVAQSDRKEKVAETGFFPLKSGSNADTRPYGQEEKKTLGRLLSFLDSILKEGTFFQDAACSGCDVREICGDSAEWRSEARQANSKLDTVKEFRKIREIP